MGLYVMKIGKLEIGMQGILELPYIHAYTNGSPIFYAFLLFLGQRPRRGRWLKAYNSLFRRLFDYRNWESVTDLQHALKRPTWEELVEKRHAKYLNS